MDSETLAREIIGLTEPCLTQGQTWPEADYIGHLRDTLRSIEKLCADEMAAQQQAQRAQRSRPRITTTTSGDGRLLTVRVEGCRYSEEVLHYDEDGVNDFVKRWIATHPRCAQDVHRIVEEQVRRAAYEDFYRYSGLLGPTPKKVESSMDRTFDEDYEDWKIGDRVAWDDERESTMSITEIDAHQRVFWQEEAQKCMTRATNLVRITFHGKTRDNHVPLCV